MNGRVGMAVLFVFITLIGTSCGDGTPSGPSTRLVLEPEEGAQNADLVEALDGTMRVIERRVDEFGMKGADVERAGSDRIVVTLPGVSPEEAEEKIGRTGLLRFCEPVQDGSGNVAVVHSGTVQYEPQTCEPVRDENGDIVVEGDEILFDAWRGPNIRLFANDQIVWQAAVGELDGVETALTSEFLEPNTTVTANQITGAPILVFSFNADGADIAEEVTGRLVEGNYPLALYMDGEPILAGDGKMIAPSVQGQISRQGQITGLRQDEAETLRRLLNTGAFPIPMRVVEAEQLDQG